MVWVTVVGGLSSRSTGRAARADGAGADAPRPASPLVTAATTSAAEDSSRRWCEEVRPLNLEAARAPQAHMEHFGSESGEVAIGKRVADDLALAGLKSRVGLDGGSFGHGRHRGVVHASVFIALLGLEVADALLE